MDAQVVFPSDEVLREEYGPEACFTRFDGFLIVHLDQPDETEIQERIAETRRDATEPNDCPLCEMMRPTPGTRIVYTEHSIQYEERHFHPLYGKIC